MASMNDRSPFERPSHDATPSDSAHADAGAPPSPPELQPRAVDPGHHDLAFAEAVPAAGPARRRRRIAALSVAAAVLLTAGAGGGAWASIALAQGSATTAALGTGAAPGQGGFGGSSGSGSSVSGSSGSGSSGSGSSGSSGSGSSGSGSSGSDSSGSGAPSPFGGGASGFGRGSPGGGSSTGSGSSAAATTAATASEVTGVVTIVSQLGFEDGESAGSGIVLTSSGRILTNNHVIDGATAVQVTVESTGRTYTADVVGTNATEDIAVLQLEGASGLTPAALDSADVAIGEDVTAVGNANGTGTLSAADGTVTAVDQTITTSSEGTTSGERLQGLIEVDADVVSGDSGGAVKNADGEVVGITTAASSGTSDITGYAIPIGTALSIAEQIVAGDDSAEITLGLPAFLGVSIASGADASGAVIGGIIDGTPAASTGLAAGDVVTALDGTAVSSGAELSAAIAAHEPGDSVRITYTDSAGDSRTVTVTLTEGPAD